MDIIKVMNLMWQVHHVKSPCNHIEIHGANRQWPKLLMPTHDSDPMGVPGSDGTHVSESPSEVPLTCLAFQLQEMDCSILDTPSLTLWSKGKERITISSTSTVLGTKLIGLTWTPPCSHKLDGDFA